MLDPNLCVVDPGPSEVKEVEMDFWGNFKIAEMTQLIGAGQGGITCSVISGNSRVAVFGTTTNQILVYDLDKPSPMFVRVATLTSKPVDL